MDINGNSIKVIPWPSRSPPPPASSTRQLNQVTKKKREKIHSNTGPWSCGFLPDCLTSTFNLFVDIVTQEKGYMGRCAECVRQLRCHFDSGRRWDSQGGLTVKTVKRNNVCWYEIFPHLPQSNLVSEEELPTRFYLRRLHIFCALFAYFSAYLMPQLSNLNSS